MLSFQLDLTVGSCQGMGLPGLTCTDSHQHQTGQLSDQVETTTPHLIVER